jgi:murein DD-endopeptidase MepM/ murein hydrolase activator NlpD
MRLRMLILCLVGASGAGTAALAQPGAAAPIQLQWPVACEPGRDCFVQNYFDRDSGPGTKDYRCGSMTYEGHDGTDIRLPNLAAMRRGVAVLAAAPGVVKGVRDGVADISIREPGAPSVKGKECGNGVLIFHAGGWQTQYCHMQRGSISVKPGQAVKAGDALGRVGLSGDTEFPHLHLSVRQNARKADPFADGAGACNSGGRSLWSPAVQARAAYRSPSVIATGFANGPVTQAAADQGSVAAPSRSSPLVAYVRAIGLQQGDVMDLTLKGPSGQVLANSINPPLDRAKAQWLAFAGKKPPAAGWARGSYTATYTVRRGGRVVAQRSWSVAL